MNLWLNGTIILMNGTAQNYCNCRGALRLPHLPKWGDKNKTVVT